MRVSGLVMQHPMAYVELVDRPAGEVVFADRVLITKTLSNQSDKLNRACPGFFASEFSGINPFSLLYGRDTVVLPCSPTLVPASPYVGQLQLNALPQPLPGTAR
jgi:hypothetical protein